MVCNSGVKRKSKVEQRSILMNNHQILRSHIWRDANNNTPQCILIIWQIGKYAHVLSKIHPIFGFCIS